MTGIARNAVFAALALLTLFAHGHSSAAEAKKEARVEFVKGDGRLAIVIDGAPVAMYSYRDEQTLRPYLEHVRTRDGVQVTRNHPPIERFDLTDHDTMHPGIWLAFGDINGMDFWRNKAVVRHARFVESPQGGPGQGSFTVLNEYVDPNDTSRIICKETTRHSFSVHPSGYLMLWNSRFSSDEEFSFGDQEEMGLGIRVATPLRVGATGAGNVPAGNGTITNSAGAQNEKALRGDTAEWCDFSGAVDGNSVGATMFCHPANPRQSRFHARDYGMLTANPFAQRALGKGEQLKTTVRPGKELRLRYGILIHGGVTMDERTIDAAFQDYLKLAEN